MYWLIGIGLLFILTGISGIFTDFSVFLGGLLLGIPLLGIGLLKLKKTNPLFFHLLKEKRILDALKSLTASATTVSAPTQRTTAGSKKAFRFSVPTHYIVFDIETTGFSRTKDRIIEIAANEYLHGEIVRQYHTYVNPGIRISNAITRLTGIKNSDVQDAPAISTVKNDLLSFFGNTVLVGHNINTFDIPFLQAQLGCEISNPRIDTLHLARNAFPGLPSYKLTVLDEILELGNVEHHRADRDILANNALLIACANPAAYKHRISNKELLNNVHIENRSLYSKVDIHTFTPTDPNKVPNTRLTGKVIVFSGELDMLPEDACQLAVNAGAILKSHISKKVDYLVLGVVDPRYLDEDGCSSKERKAHELISSGEGKITIIDEAEFLALTTPL